MEEGGSVHPISIKQVGTPVPPEAGRLDARKEVAFEGFTFKNAYRTCKNTKHIEAAGLSAAGKVLNRLSEWVHPQQLRPWDFPSGWGGTRLGPGATAPAYCRL